MSVETHTPVTFWLAKSLSELAEWIQVYLGMQKKGGGSVGK